MRYVLEQIAHETDKEKYIYVRFLANRTWVLLARLSSCLLYTSDAADE